MTGDEITVGDGGVVEGWIVDQQSLLLDAVGGFLDVEAGLREVLLHSSHKTLVEGLDAVVNVEAGLAAILPQTPLARHLPVPVASSSREPASVREVLARVSPGARIALRVRPSVVAGYEALEALDVALTDWQQVHRLVRRLDGVLSGSVVDDFEQARTLSRKLQHRAEQICDVLWEAKGFVRHGFDEALDAVLVDIRRVSGELAGASGLAVEFSSPPRASNRRFFLEARAARRAERERAEQLNQFVDRPRALVDDLSALVRRGDWAVRHLSHECSERVRGIFIHELDVHDFPVLDFAQVKAFLDDFTTADLRTAVLAGVDLDGVRWSVAKTRWPASTDVEDLKARSVASPPGSGIFTIRSGTATICEPVDA
ncbi:hypothetical protein [Streptomyces sp. CBMA152]|uniref:hypothetical protein n=1 Tax=Streptomyces sp. CBMA152 TaxID=1896312 RepID=UPI00166093E1|nr:hypothetical protein [Streptomyces sp. CBMA152]MBD0742939.1 hypothetical protein [Streptomyces sp. CBMA152]